MTQLSSGTKRMRTVDVGSGVGGLNSVACRRCRSRKVKCGAEYPSCLGCVKADVPCIIADPSASRDYTRAEVHELVQKLHNLESVLQTSSQEPEEPVEEPVLDQERSDGGEEPPTPHAEQSTDRFVGQENGVSFFLSQLQSSHGQLLPSKRRDASKTAASSLVYHPPHPFPPRDLATLAIREYFQDHYIAHPLLEPERVYATLHKQALMSTPRTLAEKHDLFQLYMALAIGSVPLFRRGVFNLHPFGFFTAALEVSPPSASSFNSLDDIENLVLIARFGFFYDIGCSLWELGRLSVRISIELGLHEGRPTSSVGSIQNIQRCRRIFWEAYLLDRFASSTLGRPFAIDDASITTGLPAPISPQDAVFSWLVRLGQLTSRMHYAIPHHRHSDARSTGDERNASTTPLGDSIIEQGDALAALHKFHGKLRECRDDAPVFETPTCLPETSHFFDMSYQEVRLRLLRISIDRLSFENRQPPKGLLHPCLQSACSIISSFEALRQKGLVTATRVYTHLIFIAGIVAVVMVNKQVDQETPEQDEILSDVDMEHWLGTLDDASFDVNPENVRGVVAIAEDLLFWFADTMPDVVVYARFFENIKQGLDRARSGLGQRDTFSRHYLTGTGAHNSPKQTGIPLNSHAHYISGPSVSRAVPADESLADSANGMSHINNSIRLNVPGNEPPLLQVPPAYDDVDVNVGFTTMDSSGLGEYGNNTGLGAFSWPFSDVLGMEELDAGLSGQIWDTIVPWQESPSFSMDSY